MRNRETKQGDRGTEDRDRGTEKGRQGNKYGETEHLNISTSHSQPKAQKQVWLYCVFALKNVCSHMKLTGVFIG